MEPILLSTLEIVFGFECGPVLETHFFVDSEFDFDFPARFDGYVGGGHKLACAVVAVTTAFAAFPLITITQVHHSGL